MSRQCLLVRGKAEISLARDLEILWLTGLPSLTVTLLIFELVALFSSSGCGCGLKKFDPFCVKHMLSVFWI